MAPVIEIDGLKKSYPGFTLGEISMKLEEGFIMGLVGPNGAGKSTLIKLMLGLQKPEAGMIRLFGTDPAKNPEKIKERIGFVFPECNWIEDMKVSSMQKILKQVYSGWNSSVFNNFLKDFGLNGGMFINKMSTGMKAKLSIAAAMSHNAELIIMDEPTSALDPVVRNEVLDILQHYIAEENTSVLFSSHISGDIEQISDYITFINGGKLIFSESSDKIFDSYRLVKGSADLLDSDTESVFDGIIRKGSTFSAICSREDRFRQVFGRSDSGAGFISEKAGVDDIMLHIVKGEKNAQSCL